MQGSSCPDAPSPGVVLEEPDDACRQSLLTVQLQAAKEAALIPPGMRILPDEERLEMLRVLQQSKSETEAKLSVSSFLGENEKGQPDWLRR